MSCECREKNLEILMRCWQWERRQFHSLVNVPAYIAVTHTHYFKIKKQKKNKKNERMRERVCEKKRVNVLFLDYE
jgi:hypothetical protein